MRTFLTSPTINAARDEINKFAAAKIAALQRTEDVPAIGAAAGRVLH
jgi:hypothetical protein